MKQHPGTILKSLILILALSSISLTAQARDSLSAVRADLNDALQAIQGLQDQNEDQQDQIDALLPSFYAIGNEGPAGGIVFHVTDGGLHGLEAAPVDQGLAEWGCSGQSIPRTVRTAVGTGAQNTDDILRGCSEAGIAAESADSYELNGFNDWFLPSRDELNLLYQQKGVVGGFASDVYWSSSEGSHLTAWFLYFSIGYQDPGFKSGSLGVRAVRAF